MEFSQDIWENIFSYFHSTYKCPSHFIAIKDTNDFFWLEYNNKKVINSWPYNEFYKKNTDRFRQYSYIYNFRQNLQITNNLSPIDWSLLRTQCSLETTQNIQGYVYGNTKDISRYTGSYYFRVFMNMHTYKNSTSKNIVTFNSRGKTSIPPAMYAGKNVLKDFIDIFETYRSSAVMRQQIAAQNSGINYMKPKFRYPELIYY